MEFHETKEKTQKEIAEVLLKDNYIPRKNLKGKFTDTFDLFRIMKISENLTKKVKVEEIQKKKNVEREFTDKKSIDFILGKKEQLPFFTQNIHYSKTEIKEIRGSDRDIIKKFDENKEEYLKNDQKNILSFTKSLIDIGHNYDMKLY